MTTEPFGNAKNNPYSWVSYYCGERAKRETRGSEDGVFLTQVSYDNGRMVRRGTEDPYRIIRKTVSGKMTSREEEIALITPRIGEKSYLEIRIKPGKSNEEDIKYIFDKLSERFGMKIEYLSESTPEKDYPLNSSD